MPEHGFAVKSAASSRTTGHSLQCIAPQTKRSRGGTVRSVAGSQMNLRIYD